MKSLRRSAPRPEAGERALSDAPGRFTGEGHRLWPAPLTEVMTLDDKNQRLEVRNLGCTREFT